MSRADRSGEDAANKANPLRDGLKHNPFAGLRGKTAGSPPDSPAPAPPPAREKAPSPPPRAREKVAAQPHAQARIVVRRERKGHAGKAVTIAEGVGFEGHDLPDLARACAKALGTGARVEDGALVVQGEQTERLIAWLASRGFTSISRGN